MKEFGNSLPASELEHLWLNICSIIFVNTFVFFFTLHVTKKFSFNILKTVSLKIEKKTSNEAQSEGHVLVNLHKTSESHLAQPIDENESKKMRNIANFRDFKRLVVVLKINPQK